MADDLRIRDERPGDADALFALIAAAFEGKPYAEGDEAALLGLLRRAGALTTSLVAEEDGRVVGQAAFSPARAPAGAGEWFALGPVAVLPAFQGRGIGSRLIRAGLDALRVRGAAGCVLVGDPAYYGRFGFVLSPGNAPPGHPAAYFQVLPMARPAPGGAIAFHEVFGPGAGTELPGRPSNSP